MVLTDEPTWMIDPLDGTTNLCENLQWVVVHLDCTSVHRVPYVAVSIGLAINKEPALGVVYAPMTNELFTALKGKVQFCFIS